MCKKEWGLWLAFMGAVLWFCVVICVYAADYSINTDGSTTIIMSPKETQDCNEEGGCSLITNDMLRRLDPAIREIFKQKANDEKTKTMGWKST